MVGNGARRLFAYGTLMVPDVFEAVCGPAAPGRHALLHDYARYRVRGHAFPGIVPVPGAVTDGLLLEPIDDAMWSRLDAFESDFYARGPVEVELIVEASGIDAARTRPSSGTHAQRSRVEASTYIVRPDHRAALTNQVWNARQFVAKHLPAYLARYT